MPVTRMMNLIKVDCGFEADIAIIVLLSRFSESNRSNFSTTRAWLDNHQDLWARINKIEPISDKIWISQTVKAVKETYPELPRHGEFSKDLLHKSEISCPDKIALCSRSKISYSARSVGDVTVEVFSML
ncbi:hypothetical protein E4U35_000475 [Claviceps purpurea]|nr:hypothetical protein E4U35_000475 [Claviceps purpurea]